MFHHEYEQEFLGLITKKLNTTFEVSADHRILHCSVAGNLKEPKQPKKSNSQKNDWISSLTVGDEVRVQVIDSQKGVIKEVLPRRSKFGRRSALPMPDKHPHEQVIAANVDQLIAVFSITNPAPHWNLLDRYLVAAEDSGLAAVICITKMDLFETLSSDFQREAVEILKDFQRIGYAVQFTSTRTGEGMEELRCLLSGRISLVIGKSGVGKSSLLNQLLPGKELKVNTVNPSTGKGRHTTTSPEMFPLDGSGAVIDTPGMREFGLWKIPAEELANDFPEMRPYLGKCRFGVDCAHDEEPGCAVRKAVMEGHIHPRRYRSYLHLRGEP
ncbi:MAG: ribosome small subunit-dependent GTPase A [Chloroflexota bacterium]